VGFDEGFETAQVGRVVDEAMLGEISVVVFFEMAVELFECFLHPFEDGHAGDDDEEFLEAVFLVQGENAAEIDVGFAGAGFHLDAEVATVEDFVHEDFVGELGFSNIFSKRSSDGNFRISSFTHEQASPSVKARLIFRHNIRKQCDGAFHRVRLMRKIRVEMEENFHGNYEL